MHPYRSHHCNALTMKEIGQTVRVSGWIHRRRNLGGLLFIDLRDHYGIVQILLQQDHTDYDRIRYLHPESVICVTGSVQRRGSASNPILATGEIEIVADTIHILSQADILPFSIADENSCAESIRLKYRFLELRRDTLQRNMVRRSRIIHSIRQRMVDLGFLEIHTPILSASSPEGARDFLVPSRLHPGHFYALPQAPQLFKQLLMLSGFDRYFQIAPCFRDEDARADRSPGEFYQLDLEMAFATQEDVFTISETVMSGLFQEFSSEDAVNSLPFPRIPYRQALLEFGCDKPDLRNPLRMQDLSEVFRKSTFNAFRTVLENSGSIRAISTPQAADQSRKFFADIDRFARLNGAKGLAYIIWKDGSIKGPIAKFLSPEELQTIRERLNIHSDSAVFFIADSTKNSASIGTALLSELAQRLQLIDETVYRFCWIIDYPMFEKDEETDGIRFSHNPFSMPQGEMEALKKQNPLDILAYQYDLVCNGVELSSGAIRNHRLDILFKAFSIAGYSQKTVQQKFSSLVNALKMGAAPHGGIAPGIERIVMLLCGESSIRAVIPFPMNQQAQDLMMNAPAKVSPEQLKELHIRLKDDDS